MQQLIHQLEDAPHHAKVALWCVCIYRYRWFVHRFGAPESIEYVDHFVEVALNGHHVLEPDAIRDELEHLPEFGADHGFDVRYVISNLFGVIYYLADVVRDADAWLRPYSQALMVAESLEQPMRMDDMVEFEERQLVFDARFIKTHHALSVSELQRHASGYHQLFESKLGMIERFFGLG